MFSRFSVKQKLQYGFGLIILLITLLSFISISSSLQTSSGFTNYREMARDSNLMGRVQANMLMVRMNAKDFFITGSHKDVVELNFYYEKVRTFIEEAQEEITDPKRAKAIDQIDIELKQYRTYFETVESLMNERNALVDQALNIEGKRIEQLLTRIMEEAYEDNITQNTFSTSAQVAGLALRNLLLARLYVNKFLKTNELSAVSRVTQEFNEMYGDFYKMQHNIQDPVRLQLLKDAFSKAKNYESAFYKVKEIIIKRNTIIANLNILGPEIATLTEDIKLEIKAVQDNMGPKLVIQNKKSIIINISIALITIIVAFFIATSLHRTIINPLEQLKKGTMSFWNFINNKQDSIDSIQINSNDEFAEIAETLNKNTQIIQKTLECSRNSGDAP